MKNKNSKILSSIHLFREMSQQDKRDWICFSIGLGTFVVFLPVLWFEFTNYDDPSYVFNNVHVATGWSAKNFIWALTTLHGQISYWHPVTWLSHQLDCQLFGLSPGAHHITNVLLHTFAGVLLFLFLNRATSRLGSSAMVATLFCIHPLHVESVAWIAERKDVLSGVFWMATLNAYAFYVNKQTVSRYLLVALLLSLGLMSKPSAVTLPFALLLLDYWPLRRLARPLTWSASKPDVERITGRTDSRATIMRLVIEKLPLFALSLAASLAAYEAQRQLGALTPVETLDRSDRIDNALISYVLYIGKMFWPSHLAVIYTHVGSWSFSSVLLAAACLAAVTCVAVRYRRSYPYLIVGWLWFLGTLVPMLGLVQVGTQSMADRYTYISLIGLFIAVSWGIGDFAGHFRVSKGGLAGFAVVMICLAAIITRHQLSHWQNSLKLFEHAVAVTRNNWMAHHIYGLVLAGNGRYEEAEAQYDRASRILPNGTVVERSRGNLYLGMGNPKRASECFKRVIAIDPSDLEAHRQLALIYAACEDPVLRNARLALRHARLAGQTTRAADSKQFDVLAAAYAENGQFDQAVAAEQQACAVAEAGKEDTTQLKERLELFKSKQPYRTDFGAKKHKILAKQQMGQAVSPLRQ